MTELLAIAEAPAAHIVPRHPADVVGDGYVVSDMGVQAIRLADDRLEDARAHVREVMRERGRSEVAWWTSALTRPADLAERLGLERGETLTALALTTPPQGTPTAAIRRVESLEEFVEAQAIDRIAHGAEPDRDLERAAPFWERLRELFLLWLAFDEAGRPVGMGRAARTDGALMLIGGAVLPEARGRGIYRSLVHARWEDGGGRPLVVAANGQSGPILERLGFERLGEIQLWLDRL